MEFTNGQQVTLVKGWGVWTLDGYNSFRRMTADTPATYIERLDPKLYKGMAPQNHVVTFKENGKQVKVRCSIDCFKEYRIEQGFPME